VNTQQAVIGGAILSTQLQARPFLVTAGVMNIYRAIDESPGAGGARLQRIPVFTASLDVERPVGPDRYGYGLRLGLAGPDHDNGGYPGVVTYYDGRTTLDLYARYKIAGPVVLTVRGKNVGNIQYAPVFGYPAPGRTLEIEFASR
jgi:outer membrane receptor protein involved in Fe transport